MKGKFFLCFLLISILIGLGVAAWKIFSVDNTEIQEDYIPQEEISEEQDRMTLVTLYFIDKESKTIIPEARLIDAKQLVSNPCGILIELLLNGPKNEKLESVIPKETKLNSIIAEDRTVIADFSETLFKEAENEENQRKVLSSIKKTLLELSEIDSVKILIDGNEVKMDF